MKTAELTGAALDWAVAKCEGVGVEVDSSLRLAEIILDKAQDMTRYGSWVFKPSTNWAQGGPIIEREGINLKKNTIAPKRAMWVTYSDDMQHSAFGSTPLIAAMRCYVASKLGDEVEIPQELI